VTGRERVGQVLTGQAVDRPPVLPIVHTGLASVCGFPLGGYFARSDVMARVIVEGRHRLGFDGVQLSLGVTAEAEALGAAIEQPPDAAPVLREHLLSDLACLDSLRLRDPANGGRIPLFFDAVERTVKEIGGEAFILATLRGPLLIGTQLRGPEALLIDMLEAPEAVDRVLEYTTEVAVAVGQSWLASGAHGLLLGEATCSPSFISPALYRETVLPHHCRLVAELKRMGWPFVGLHVCGKTEPIIADMITTGVDFLDVDYQVPAARAIELGEGKVALRGNLDPSAVFRFGSPETVRQATTALCRSTVGARWIVSSGCDIPPGTPVANLAACMEAVLGFRP
jgi:uroporphyrinogen decarboxylase